MTEKLFRLEADYAYGDVNYVGFVLDALRLYLGLEEGEYRLHGMGFLLSRQRATRESDGVKLEVVRVKENLYLIEGFPADRSFISFWGAARGLLEEMFKNRRSLG